MPARRLLALLTTALVAVAALGLATPAHAAGAPGAPTGLTGTPGPQVGKVKLTWSAPVDTGGGITTYLYDVALGAPGATGFTAPVDLRSTRLSATVGCAATYPAVCSYRIYARSVGGTSAPSTAVSAAWTAPSAARGVAATTTDFSDVTLTWKPPATTGGLSVRYAVEVAPDDAVFTPIATGLILRSLTATGSCTGASSCRYRVVASNDAGTAPPSTPATVKVAPGPVTGLSLTHTADDPVSGTASVTLAWTEPSTGLHDGAFEAQSCAGWCSASAPGWSSSTTVAHATTSWASTCAGGSVTCTYRVRATNTRGGVGRWVSTAIVPWAPYGVSAATGTATDTIELGFHGPAESGPAGTGTPTYRFWVCTSSCGTAASWVEVATTASYPPATSPATVTLDCPAATTCQVRVVFTGASGLTSMFSPAASGAGAG